MDSQIYNIAGINLPKFNPIPFGTYFLMGIVFAILLLFVLKHRNRMIKFDKKKIIFLVVAILLVVPINLVGIKGPIHALDIEEVFNVGYLFWGFLHVSLIIFTYGLIGLEGALGIGVLTGLAQSLIHQQDPAYVVIFAAIPAILLSLMKLQKSKVSFLLAKNSWIRILLTWIALVPVIWLLIGTRALFLRLPFGIHVIRYCLYVWLSLLPAFFICTILYWVIQTWFSQFWQEEFLLNQENEQDSLKKVIEQIRLLGNGNYDLELLAKPTEPREKALYQALERLRKNLQFKHEAQSRLLSLDPTHYSKEGYDLILSSVLRAALTRDASSARLLLLDEPVGNEPPNIRSRFGQGENTRLYAYLDAKILDKIGFLDQLVLTDIKLDHYFGLSAGTPFPQSIIALPLKDKGRLQGLLWVGFEQKKWFSPEDIKFYQELAFRASVSMSTKQETQQLMADKNTFESALNAIPHTIFVLSNDDEIIFMNERAKSLARNTDGLLEVKEGKHRFINQKILTILKESGKQGVFDNGIELGNGTSYDLEHYPLIISEKPEGSVIFLVDNAWLTQINQQRTEFVSDISHDLQSPIRMIQGHLILLQRMGNLNKEQLTYVKLIGDYTESMNRLVNKMLNLERLDAVETLHYTRFDFQEKINEVIRLLTPSAQQKKIRINTDFQKMTTPFISADQTLIQQAMYNLIENAIKYSSMGGEVQVSAEKDASWLHVCVADKGKGIAPIDQPSLFNRFYSSGEEEEFENKVLGLGLAIVKSVAEKHGGTVRAESQLGEGSRFYLDIPIHKLA